MILECKFKILFMDCKSREIIKLLYSDIDKFNRTVNIISKAEEQGKAELIYFGANDDEINIQVV